MDSVNFNPETHEYDGGRLVSVTQALAVAGLVDSTWFTDEARDRGSAVHLATRYYDEGDLDLASVAPEIAGYLESYIKWKTAARVEMDWIERPMKAGALYAGMPDRIIVVRPRALYDLKSGPYQPHHAIQTALYVNMLDDPYSYRRFGLYLKSDGKIATAREFPRNEYAADLSVGLSAVNIANWKRRNNK